MNLPPVMSLATLQGQLICSPTVLESIHICLREFVVRSLRKPPALSQRQLGRPGTPRSRRDSAACSRWGSCRFGLGRPQRLSRQHGHKRGKCRGLWGLYVLLGRFWRRHRVLVTKGTVISMGPSFTGPWTFMGAFEIDPRSAGEGNLKLKRSIRSFFSFFPLFFSSSPVVLPMS